MRALPLVLAALLVLSPIAGASVLSVGAADAADGIPVDGATSTSPESATPTPAALEPAAAETAIDATNHTPANATGNVLSIREGEVRRSTTGQQHVDLGPAVSFGTNASATRMETLAIVERINGTEGAERRSEEIDAAITDIEQRIGQLREREREAIAAYGAGEVTPRAFLLELARIDAQARAIQDRRARLVAVANEEELELDRGRIATIERRIDALTGPVRAHARDVLRGVAPTNRFFVATGEDSVVLSTITEGTYVREAFRGDRYTVDGEDIGPETALQIVADSYPTLWELRQNNTDVVGSNGNYLVRIPHARGTLQAFVDGDSREVYKEFQMRSLEQVEPTRTTTATRDGLALTANYTYPGGPIRLRLVDTEEGTSVDANVTLSEGGQESELLGRSGADGTLWTLAPNQQFTVTAIRGNDVVVVTLQPSDPPRASTASGGANTSTTG